VLRQLCLSAGIFMLTIAMQNVARSQIKVEPSDKTPEIVKSSLEAVVLIVTSDANSVEIRQGRGFTVFAAVKEYKELVEAAMKYSRKRFSMRRF